MDFKTFERILLNNYNIEINEVQRIIYNYCIENDKDKDKSLNFVNIIPMISLQMLFDLLKFILDKFARENNIVILYDTSKKPIKVYTLNNKEIE